MSVDPFSSEFARLNPGVVARELEKFSAQDILAFVATLDHALGGQLLAALQSRVLLRILEIIDPALLAEILGTSAPRAANVMLAHIPSARYQDILDVASSQNRIRLQSLFGIGHQNVGLHATNQFIRLFGDETCGAAARDLIASEKQDTALLIAVDREGVYLGILPVMEVIRAANAERHTVDFALKVRPIMTDASVSAVLQLRAWDDYASLPIVNQQSRLEGVVALRDLRELTQVTTTVTDQNPLSGAFDSFLQANATALEFILGEQKR